MAQLRGIDVIGQGLLRGIPGLAGVLNKYTQEQKKREEVAQIVQGLMNGQAPTNYSPQGGIQNQDGSLNPLVGSGGTPMFSQQNLGALLELGDRSPQALALIKMLQPKNKSQLVPGYRNALDQIVTDENGNIVSQKNLRSSLPEKETQKGRGSYDWVSEGPSGKVEIEKIPGTTSTRTWEYAVDRETNQFVKGPNGKPMRRLVTGGTESVRSDSPQQRKFNLVKAFNADPNVRKAVGSIGSAAELDQLADSSNPIAQNAIATIAARASGEVGNLSEADKAPFGGSQAIIDRLNQFKETSWSGLRTPENRKWIKGLAQVFRDHGLRMQSMIADTWSKQYSSVAPELGTPEELYHAFSAGAERPKPQTQSSGRFKILEVK